MTELIILVPCKFKNQISKTRLNACYSKISSANIKLRKLPDLFIDNEERGKDNDFDKDYLSQKASIYDEKMNCQITIVSALYAIINVTSYVGKENYHAKRKIEELISQLISQYFCGLEFLHKYSEMLTCLTGNKFTPKIEMSVDGDIKINHSKEDFHFLTNYCSTHFYQKGFEEKSFSLY